MKPGPTIGVDVGVGAMAVCSDGTTVENPKALATGLKRLRRLDKAIARSRNVHWPEQPFQPARAVVRQATATSCSGGQCSGGQCSE